jgi:CRP-like cAMP-binding protein
MRSRTVLETAADVFVSRGPAARVLEFDADLGRDIDPAQRPAALAACTGRAVVVEPGWWRSLGLAGERLGAMGFLVVDGVLCRETSMAQRVIADLLCAGDVILLAGRSDGLLPSATTVTAITRARMVGLGPEFAQAAARWPSLLVALHERAELGRRRVAEQGLIGTLSRAEDRLLLFFWHLAERVGHVCPEGVIVPLDLTHEMLGLFVGARRSTVTLALRELEQTGAATRTTEGRWLLPRGSERLLDAVLGPTPGRPALLGRMLLHRQQTHGRRRELRGPSIDAETGRRRVVARQADGPG